MPSVLRFIAIVCGVVLALALAGAAFFGICAAGIWFWYDVIGIRDYWATPFGVLTGIGVAGGVIIACVDAYERNR